MAGRACRGVAGAAVNRSGGRSGSPGHGARPGCGRGRGGGCELELPNSIFEPSGGCERRRRRLLRPGDGARSCAVSPGVSEGRGRYGRGGGRRRGRELGAFPATQSLICCSRVQPPLLCLDAPPAPSLPPPRAARRSIRLLCGSAGCLTSCHECALCLRMARRKGRGRREQAGSWWASFRGHRDRDDGGQDADGRGAEQRRLDFYRGPADGGFGDVSDDVWFD